MAIDNWTLLLIVSGAVTGYFVINENKKNALIAFIIFLLIMIAKYSGVS